MSQKPNVSIDEMIRALDEAGFEVRRRARYVKHTFEIEEKVFRAFREIVDRKAKRLKDAVTEALLLWVERNR